MGEIIGVALVTGIIAYYFHLVSPQDPEGRHDGYATGKAWRKEREKIKEVERSQ
ncbi:MAG: hypothetical protein ABJF04_09385 [Reichenbachiella sp.]|uniref:hypothetical protein n=1 Tax=Reichenbachiella sp. TaxID=2184521 RepID=UPI0032656844